MSTKIKYSNQLFNYIFGFVLLTLLFSIAEGLTHLAFHYFLLENYALSDKVKLAIIALPASVYLIVLCLSIYKLIIKKKTISFSIDSTLNKLLFLLLLVSSILSPILIRHFSTKAIQSILNDYSQFEYISSIDLAEMDEFVTSGLYISKWVFIILLVIVIFYHQKRHPYEIPY